MQLTHTFGFLSVTMIMVYRGIATRPSFPVFVTQMKKGSDMLLVFHPFSIKNYKSHQLNLGAEVAGILVIGLTLIWINLNLELEYVNALSEVDLLVYREMIILWAYFQVLFQEKQRSVWEIGIVSQNRILFPQKK